MKQYCVRRELTRRSLLAGGAGVLLTIRQAHAESFPNGPVKIVTSVSPGAAPISRMVADLLTQLWGQQVIVLNQPGGAGAVAIKAVAPATADGHTLYMALASNFIALPELQKNFPVDLVRDFVPIGFVGEQPLGIAVMPALGVNTLPELIALLKSKPGDASQVQDAAAVTGEAADHLVSWVRALLEPKDRRFCAAAARTRLVRGSHRSDRVSLGRGDATGALPRSPPISSGSRSLSSSRWEAPSRR